MQFLLGLSPYGRCRHRARDAGVTRDPSHNSKTVLYTVYVGGDGTAPICSSSSVAAVMRQGRWQSVRMVASYTRNEAAGEALRYL